MRRGPLSQPGLKQHWNGRSPGSFRTQVLAPASSWTWLKSWENLGKGNLPKVAQFVPQQRIHSAMCTESQITSNNLCFYYLCCYKRTLLHGWPQPWDSIVQLAPFFYLFKQPFRKWTVTLGVPNRC